MRLVLHPMVRRDLREILDYYDSRSDSAGDRLFEEFQQAIDRIKAEPTRFHPLDGQWRRCNLRRFPYHLVYEVDGEVVLVAVLRHHRRDPGFGLRRRWR